MNLEDSKSNEALRQIDAVCDRFEAELVAGRSPKISDHVDTVPEALRSRLFRELLLLEIEIGQAEDQKSYFQRYPQFREVIEQLFAGLTTTRLTRDSASESPFDRYSILQRIGAGGMGEVFLADQTSPVRRRVAIKIIKRGMDTEQVIARFEAERQALAMMDHPGIARVFEAGVTGDGRPFFAMEYVNGVPITDYCDRHKLDPHDRLALFVQVCRAVQHAHQKGIIHRDLKPSNILVAESDDQPIVKVIDFGLAKAVHGPLTDRSLFTGQGQILGTLAYMSPEQADGAGLDIDTRTDVYSLGVVLYELLTGSTPLGRERLRSEALDLILRLIREEEAPRPSFRLGESADAHSITEQRSTDSRKLGVILRGDLDWIAMKALEKDRARRYATPSALGDDVLRFLQNEPVEARPPSFSYRFRKAARRHRRTFITAISILTLLVGGLIGTITGWAKADRLTRITELRRVFDTQLLEKSRPRGSLTIEQTDELLSVCDRLAIIDSGLAEPFRRRAFEAMFESLTEQISAQRLSESDIARLGKSIEQLQDLGEQYPSVLVETQLAVLRTSLAGRQRDWMPFLVSSQPLNNQDLVPIQGNGILLDNGALEQVNASQVVPLVLSLASPVNLDVSATFVRGLSSTAWVGLAMNEQDNGSHYRFILSSGPIRVSHEPGLPAVADENRQSLLAAISNNQPLLMSIIGSGRLLAERSISLRDATVRLSARREGDLLLFTVNGSQTLRFEDAFPLSRTSGKGPAILWPVGVAISDYQVQSQAIESAEPSPLERADSLFARGDYLQATRFYSQVDTPEASYKRAVCEEYLGRENPAPIFEWVARVAPSAKSGGEPTTRWHLLANLQLLRLYGPGNPVGFQTAIDQITSGYAHQLDYILRVTPRPLQRDLERFLQKDGARWRIGLRTRGDIGELKLAIGFQEPSGADPERVRATKWRLADAYRVAGSRKEARALLQALVDETYNDRFRSREFAAVLSDLCWMDFVDQQPQVAEVRLRRYLDELGDEYPPAMSFLLIDLARALMLQSRLEAARQAVDKYFEVAEPTFVSHGEFVEGCLVAGLIQSRLGKPNQAKVTWKSGLRKNWKGSLDELAGRDSVWGLRLIDAHRTIEGEALLEPLAGETSAVEILRGARLDIEDSGLPATLLQGPVAVFFLGRTARRVVDQMFAFPNGNVTRDKMILHQVSLREQFRIPLVSILFEAVRYTVFDDEELSDAFVVAGRAVCEELVEHYDDERLDPMRHFPLIFHAYQGTMSAETWQQLQSVLSPAAANGVALLCAKRNLKVNESQARRFLQVVVQSPDSPAAFRSWARTQLEELD